MSKDISGVNRQGDEIASLYYVASNESQILMYYTLDPRDVEGRLRTDNDWDQLYSEEEIKVALEKFNSLTLEDFYGNDDKVRKAEMDKLKTFLENCLEWAKKEGQVKVYFL